MSNIDKGVKVKSLGVFLQTTPSAVQVYADCPIQTTADLAGKTIAVSAGDAPTTTFPIFLDRAGVPEDQVQKQSLDSAGKIAAMLSGRVDGLIANTSTIESSPELVQAMVDATTDSFEAAIANPEEAVKPIVGKDPQTPPESVLLQHWQETIPLLTTENTEGMAPGMNSDEDWANTISVLSDVGLTEEGAEAFQVLGRLLYLHRGMSDDISAITTERPTMTDTAVFVENLTVQSSSKRSDVTALADVDLRVVEGEFVFIAGPSGCGKSTLLRVVAGLTGASRGSVSLRDREVTGPQRNIGYIFQRATLLEWRTVRKNILLQGEMRGMNKKAVAAKAYGHADHPLRCRGGLPRQMGGRHEPEDGTDHGHPRRALTGAPGVQRDVKEAGAHLRLQHGEEAVRGGYDGG
ncbi:ABC transporter substrate-binding protein [Rhodococcus sp. BP-241]|uniref:ABC transporter substrate-binding protein n=1 Tax=Rhodococcus sp. BP-241 TaxID=2739441 RepID=UPI0021BFF8EF|nr:ABC transporter substrate-binding protein [Rhodococcus sp. BP-241]